MKSLVIAEKPSVARDIAGYFTVTRKAMEHWKEKNMW